MYGKAKVGRPDWYMMGACIVFALTFSLRSVPLAVLLLLFMPFSLLSLTGELPLPTRNAPICQTLLCISIPLLVIGAFSSLLLLLPKLLIPSACVWLFGGALMLFLPPGTFRKSRMAMYWAVICFAAVVALLMMLLQRYQAYGDLYEGLSYDILRVMMNARTHPQVLYSAYVSGLAALDAKRTAALESLAALTGCRGFPRMYCSSWNGACAQRLRERCHPSCLTCWSKESWRSRWGCCCAGANFPMRRTRRPPTAGSCPPRWASAWRCCCF